jgi:hypothetical protein
VGALTGAKIGLMVATAAIVAAVATGASVGANRKANLVGICPNSTDYDVYLGRLNIYFDTPLDPLTQDKGGQLEDIVVGR